MVVGSRARADRLHARGLIGFAPRDNAETFADEVPPVAADADPVAERYQGGTFCADGYTRATPAPTALFRTGA
jgi:uronate dehydrogenase